MDVLKVELEDHPEINFILNIDDYPEDGSIIEIDENGDNYNFYLVERSEWWVLEIKLEEHIDQNRKVIKVKTIAPPFRLLKTLEWTVYSSLFI